MALRKGVFMPCLLSSTMDWKSYESTGPADASRAQKNALCHHRAGWLPGWRATERLYRHSDGDALSHLRAGARRQCEIGTRRGRHQAERARRPALADHPKLGAVSRPAEPVRSQRQVTRARIVERGERRRTG